MTTTFEGPTEACVPAGEQASGVITKAGNRDPRDHVGPYRPLKGFQLFLLQRGEVTGVS